MASKQNVDLASEMITALNEQNDNMIYLTRSDVSACDVSLARSLEISEQTYAEHAKGNYEMPPKPGVHPDTCPGAFHHAMPAYLPNSHAVGIKWVAVYGHNPSKYNCNSTSALMILNDEQTGYPIAIMEAGLITAIRTANASGVSAKYLARKDSKTVGIVRIYFCNVERWFDAEYGI